MGLLNDAPVGTTEGNVFISFRRATHRRKEIKTFPSVVLTTGLVLLTFLLVASSALAAAPEAPVTRTVVPSGTSAVFHGELNPGRGVTGKAAYYFAYITGGSPCTESGRKTAPETMPYPEAEGYRTHVSEMVTGLEPNQEYQVCLVAANPVELSEISIGNQVSFRTLVVAPEIVSSSEKVKNVTPFSANVEAEINPENNSVSCAIEYGLTTSYGSMTGCGNFSGYSKQSASGGVSGLTPGREYHFRVALENETTHAKEYGSDTTFKTLSEAEAKPVVESEKVEAASITPVGATVEAEVNPDYLETSCKVEYSTVRANVEDGKAEGVQECSVSAGGPKMGVSVGLSGLTPSKTYYYRLVVSDTGAPHLTGDGSVQSFTTGAERKPVIEGETTSGVTPIGATLEATVNPEYAKTTCKFEYGLASGSGKEHKEPCSPPTLEGSGGQGVSATITGLTAKTKYKFTVVAEDAAGTETAAGAFETATAEKPTVESIGASSITPFEEMLEAKVNPDHQGTSCKFEYGKNLVTEHEVACETPTLEGGSEQAASAHATDLTANKTYKYRVVLENETSKNEGKAVTEEGEFTTSLPVPLVEGESASEVTNTTVILEAQINPEAQSTTYGFEYAKSELELLEGKGELAESNDTLTGGSTEHVSLKVEGLTPHTQYYYRATATNASGTETGPDSSPFLIQSFTTGSVPGAITQSYTVSEAGDVTLYGSVNPSGIATKYYFQYGGTTGYGSQTTPQDAGEGDNIEGVNVALGHLSPGVTYHYRIVAVNINNGTEQRSYGEDKTLETSATPPVLSEVGVSGVTQNAATITATLDPQNLPARWELQLGPNPSSLSYLASGDTSTTTALNASDESLSPGTTYYYKVIVINANGTIESPEGSFTTASTPAPVTLGPPAPIVFPPSANQLANVKTSTSPVPVKKKKVAKKKSTKKRKKSHGGKKGHKK
jgi:phosphodiesterase/alkaline phosphatase D-like protein